MNSGTLWRPGGRWWTIAARVALAGLILADVWIGRPAPGLSGTHLVLLVSSVLAAAVWVVWLPAVRTAAWLQATVVLAGMVAACVAALTSPTTAAQALPLAIGVMAGSSLVVPVAAGVAAGGLATLGVGSLVVSPPGFSLLGSFAAVIGGVLAGLWRSQYRVRAEQAEMVAVQTRRAEQEHIRAQVLDERTRIARELHDILAHTLGGLVVQLDAADALLGEGSDAEGGRRLVGGARRLAVEGLREARQAVAALRTDPADLADAVAGLVADHGGDDISYEVSGTPRRLAPEASLAVYRTAQEALANARKHAPDAAVRMRLWFAEQTAGLRVTSDLPRGDSDGPLPLADTGGGYGLSGLCERAELLGGVLQAGPDGSGWVVDLTVPA